MVSRLSEASPPLEELEETTVAMVSIVWWEPVKVTAPDPLIVSSLEAPSAFEVLRAATVEYFSSEAEVS